WSWNPHINERWRLFCRNIGQDGAPSPSQRDLHRAGKTVKDFNAFYIAEIGGLKANVAESFQGDLLKSLAIHRPLITHNRHQLDWAFEQIMDRRVPVLRSEQILFYMAVARYSGIPIERLHTFSQFSKSPDGRWCFDSGTRSEKLIELSFELSAHLERYLDANQIDQGDPLPPAPLFPTNNGSGSYSRDVLAAHLQDCRERLANAASSCQEPEIFGAVHKFRRMTFVSIRRSSIYCWRVTKNRLLAEKYHRKKL
ncbi:hypothetical protein ALP66_03409, partial [Pseudomonas amygdali pv. photiniae]